MSRNHIIYIILHNQLLFFDHSFFHSIFFLHLELSLIPMVVFILRGGSTALWISFFFHGVSDPGSFRFMFIELSSLVLQNKSRPYFLVGGCTGPFLQFKCTSCMVRTICITTNSYASCNYLDNTTFIHISHKLSRCLPSLPWHHWDCALIQYVRKEVW